MTQQQNLEIVKGLYLTDYEHVDSVVAKYLRPQDVIVKCAQELAASNKWDAFTVIEWDLDDSPQQLVQPHLSELVSIIVGYLNRGQRVVVYCHMGVSRSVTLVAAVVMRMLNVSSTVALDLIQRKRPQAGPNYGFVQQLALLDA